MASVQEKSTRAHPTTDEFIFLARMLHHGYVWPQEVGSMDNFTTDDMLPLSSTPDPVQLAEQEDRMRTPPGVPTPREDEHDE